MQPGCGGDRDILLPDPWIEGVEKFGTIFRFSGAGEAATLPRQLKPARFACLGFGMKLGTRGPSDRAT